MTPTCSLGAALALVLSLFVPAATVRAQEGGIALEVTRELASSARPSGGAASRAALEGLARRFKGAGFEPRWHLFETVSHEGVTVLGVEHLNPTEARFTGGSGRNLWVAVAGRSPDVVLVSAHVDTDGPDVPGARDDAAGVGILVESALNARARALREGPPPRTLVFAVFECEERGLFGSRAFARDAPAGRVAFALSIDSVGTKNLALNGLGPTVDRALAAAALAGARASGVPVSVPIPHLLFSRAIPQAERSDHRSFAARGTPAFHLLSRGEEGFDPCYHTPRDVPDRVEQEPLARSVRFLGAFLARVDEALDHARGDARFLALALPDPLGFAETTPVLVPGTLARVLALLFGITAVACLGALVRRTERRLRAAFSMALGALAGAATGAAFLIPFFLALVAGSAPVPWHAGFERYVLAGTACAGTLLALLAGWRRFRLRVSPGACAATGTVSFLAVSVALAGIGVPEIALLPALGAAALASSALSRRRWLRAFLALLALPALGLVMRPAIYREGVLTGTLPSTGAAWVLAAVAVGAAFGPALGYLCQTLAVLLAIPRKTGRPARLAAIAIVLLASVLTARALCSTPYTDAFPQNDSEVDLSREAPEVSVTAQREGGDLRIRVHVARPREPVDHVVISYTASAPAGFALGGGGGTAARAAGEPVLVQIFGPGPIEDERVVTLGAGATLLLATTVYVLEPVRVSPPARSTRRRAVLVDSRRVG